MVNIEKSGALLLFAHMNRPLARRDKVLLVYGSYSLHKSWT